MANPYTSVSISGYNTSPPADDGSQVSANQVTWAKHKTKLADPVKTLAESINTNVNAAFATVDDASNLTTGELPDARLSSNVPLLDASNTFTNSLNTLSASAPALDFNETDGGSDEKRWRVQADGDQWSVSTRTDANASGATAFAVTRSGTTVTGIVFQANVEVTSSQPRLIFDETDGGSDERVFDVISNAGALLFRTRTDADGSGETWLQVDRTGTTVDTVDFPRAVRARLTTRSTSSTLAVGQIHSRSANTTVNTAAAGNWVAIYNNGTSAITLTQGSGLTLQLAGVNGTSGSRTLAAKGFAFIWYDTASVAVCGGSGVS